MHRKKARFDQIHKRSNSYPLKFKMDAFYLNQSVSEPSLEVVPIGTCHVPIGTPKVLIGTLKCQAQFPTLVQSGLFFRDFLSRELHLDAFLTSIPK